MIRPIFPLFIILFAVLLFSCAGPYAGVQKRDSIPTGASFLPVSEISNEMEVPAEYVLGPGDVLDIDVFQVDDLKRTVRVNSSGTIKFPPAGLVEVAGLTVTDAENELGNRLSPYLRDPMVTIFIAEYASQKVTILGAVKEPKMHPLTGPTRLLDVISAAGGLTEDAGNVCYIIRNRETIVVNIRNLLEKGQSQLNVPIIGGDSVHVTRGGTVFVDGSVNGPGSFTMKGEVTLTQAIAMAKGMKFEAETDNVRIYRDTGGDIREIIEADYHDIIENRKPDILLADGDIVVVPESGVKDFFTKFFRSVRFFVNFGDVTTGVGY